jgi:hypothetical protein
MTYHVLARRWRRSEPLVPDDRLLLLLDGSRLGAEGGDGSGAECDRPHAACRHLQWRAEGTLSEHRGGGDVFAGGRGGWGRQWCRGGA